MRVARAAVAFRTARLLSLVTPNPLESVVELFHLTKHAAQLVNAIIRPPRAEYEIEQLGPRHADTLQAQSNVGETLLALGDAQGAVALLEVAALGLQLGQASHIV